MTITASDRLSQLFLPALGRKLVLMSGDAIIDLFFLGNVDGPQELVDALHLLGAREGFDLTISFDCSGQPRLGKGMEKVFGDITAATTASRPGEAPKQTFQPRDGAQAARQTEQQRAAVQQLDAEASSALRNLLGKAEKAVKSGRRVLVVFREPEELCFGGVTSHARDVLKQAIALSVCAHAHPESRVVFIVKPGRREELANLLDVLAVARPVIQRMDISPPGQKELRAFLDYQMNANTKLLGTDGERSKVVSEWCQRGELLRNLDEALRSLMLASDCQRVERVLERQRLAETAEDVLKDLDRLVGLDQVKAHLRELLQLVEQQNRDRHEGRVVSPTNTHMLFLGNPGTGKTEVARIVGRYLRAIGLRTTGAFVEISRSDIASQFNSGECIQKMRDAINRAMGGVLFIDEAYQFADGEWMRGALETLMKDMEDRRDALTVIFAGYAEQMQKVWNVNPGFRSRIPRDNDFIFPDYKSKELEEMFRRECERRHLELAPGSRERAEAFIEAELRRGRFGNARGVRTLVETIEQNRAKMGGGNVSLEMVPEPPHFDGIRVEALLQDLDKTLVGVEALKEHLDRVARLVKRSEELGDPFEQPLHCRFVGPPGTGKTTAARKIGATFQAMGLLSRGHLVEVNPIADLGSQFISEYAQRVKDQFRLARGGVLFIDEAYQLAEQEQGHQIIHQIVQELTGPGFADTMLILAGYRDKMNDLMAVNSGLDRRVPHEIVFAPFGIDDLVELFHQRRSSKGYVIFQPDRAAFDQALRAKLQCMQVSPTFGNAAAIEELVFEVIDRQIERVQNDGELQKMRILIEDLGAAAAKPDDVTALLKAFEERFVGLVPVKHRIRAIVQETRMSQALGGSRPKAPRLLFLGNPGTGKTSAARELSRILRALGCTASDRFVETRGTELKAAYLGQTKDRVLKAFQDARGGVLFIDEAYGLGAFGNTVDAYAIEAIDTIVGQVTLSENSQTVVILSGYSEPMRQFLKANHGLASRFPDTVQFPDYSEEECLEILSRWFLRVEPGNCLPAEDPHTRQLLLSAMAEARKREGFGNAREMEAMGGRIREVRNMRVADMPLEKIREQAKFTPQDIEQGVRLWRENQMIG